MAEQVRLVVIYYNFSTQRGFIRVFNAVFVAVFLRRGGSLLETFEQLKEMKVQEIDKGNRKRLFLCVSVYNQTRTENLISGRNFFDRFLTNC